MFKSLSCQEVRQLDVDAIQQLGLPSLLLMENAARGVVDEIVKLGLWNSITIVAGPGNNGGDGLAVARLLAALDMNAKVLLIRQGKTLSVDASENLKFLFNSGIQVEEPEPDDIRIHCKGLTDKDLIVDALLGTGVRGTVNPAFAEVIRCINESSAHVLSADVPSGLDCDRGIPCGDCVRAHTTVTFVSYKHGFLQANAHVFTGTIKVCHIGIPQRWLETWHTRLRSN